MESLLSGAKLTDELEFFKRHLEVVAAQKVKFAAVFVPSLEHRPKRATLANIPVCEPPATRQEDDEQVGVETITLSIKSLKPSLVFSLACPSTSTISSLKALLAEQNASAPAPELQRWILKGKGMGDDKLLREFTVKNGAVVNLMIVKPAAGSLSNDEPAVPALTLTSESQKPSISVAIPAVEPTPAPSHRDIVLASPALWVDTLALLRKHFGASDEGERAAAATFESWLSSSMDKISASDKAMIREKTGISVMGGL